MEEEVEEARVEERRGEERKKTRKKTPTLRLCCMTCQGLSERSTCLSVTPLSSNTSIRLKFSPFTSCTCTNTHTNVQSMSWCTPQHINGLSPKYKQLAQVLVPTIIHIHLHPKRSHGTHLYTLVRLHPRTHT